MSRVLHWPGSVGIIAPYVDLTLVDRLSLIVQKTAYVVPIGKPLFSMEFHHVG
jgi:hypothetical protein